MIAQTQATDRPFLRADLTHPINKDCVLWLPCTESAGNRAYDLMRTNHMALTNAPSWAGSERGQCLSFNGTSNYGTVTHNASISFDVSAGSTFSVWVKPNTVSGGSTFSSTNPRNILAKYSSDASFANYNLRLVGGSINFLYRNSANTGYVGRTTTTEVVTAGEWQHICAVHRGTQIDLYRNGVLYPSSGGGTVTDSSRTNTLNLYVGSNGTSTDRYFDGRLKHVRIWRRALSPSEVSVLYTRQLSGLLSDDFSRFSSVVSTTLITAPHLTGSETVVSSGGTLSLSVSAGAINYTGTGTAWDIVLSDGTHYSLDEGTGTTVNDRSGVGNHGTLAAGAWSTQDSYNYRLDSGAKNLTADNGPLVDLDRSQNLSNVDALTSQPYGASFNGSSSQIAMTTQMGNVLGTDGDYVEFYMYRTANADETVLGDSAGAGRLAVQTSTIEVGDSGKLIYLSIPFPTNQWVKVKVTNESGTIYAYINGTKQPGFALSVAFDLDVIGQNNSLNWFTGSLRSLKIKQGSNLVEYDLCGDALDSGGDENHGTPTGITWLTESVVTTEAYDGNNNSQVLNYSLDS